VNVKWGDKREMIKMGNKGICKILAILMVFVLAMVVVMPSAAAVSESDGDSSSATIYVPDSYPTIQAAVDAASPGDTIIVRDGTYRDNIDVDKRLTIKSENGSGNCIVEAEDRDDNVFEITTNYVNISGFTVKDAAGISSMQLNRADYCNISNNNVMGKGSNSFNGIHLSHSSNNIISNNNNYNNQHGIRLDYSSNNTITNNDNRDNLIDGIALFFSSNNNTITNNNNYNCESNFGIYIFSSSRNTIENNNNHANARGIYLNSASNNIISNNANTNNSYGIYLQHHSSNNKIYLNNFINNTDNVCTHNSTNIWNSTDAINYSYNGSRYTNYIGNYWDDYTGNDTDDDGMGDTHYCINSDKDNYPLMQPWENYFLEENGTNNKNIKLAFSSYYQPINISVNPSVPPYPLPLNLSNITNIEDITAKLGLNETAEELLETNGFVILDYGQEDDIVAPYKDMKDRGIPIFVTTDTLLHLYHIQFNEILKGIEEREFFDALVDMSNAMLNQSVKDYDNF